MKLFKRTLIEGTNWALAGLLGILGFNSSCDPVDEYGTPHANYKISGHVTNSAGEVIKGIHIELEEPPYSSYLAHAYTNEKGEYEIERETTGRTDGFRLFVSDVDGKENGSYKNDTIKVTIEDKDYYDKGKDWNVGNASKKVNIILKEKVSTDE